MLEGMRKHFSWIILVIAAVFILSMAIGGISSIFVKNSNKYVGVIENRNITYPEFKDMLGSTYTSYTQENPDTEIDDKISKDLNDKTWNNLVQVTLFAREIKKRHIRVTEDDVIAKLQNPADDIKDIEQFQTDGVFDSKKYTDMLYDNADFASYMERRVRGMLPYDLLYENVKSEVVFTPADLEDQYIKDNTKADAKIIYFDPKLAGEIEVTDEEIQAYYNEHLEDYKKGPARKLKIVSIPLEPSEADKAVAKVKIDSLYQFVISGADFAETARDFSEDTSASNGGDLGFFNEGKMVKEFNDVAFAMKIGEISEPVMTQYGWHIIKCTGKQTDEKGLPQVKASHILIKFAPSEDTKQNLEILANDLYDKIKEEGIDKVAKDLAYEVQESKEFYVDTPYISNVGKNEELVAFAFHNKVGKIHEPLKQSNGSYIVAQISYKVGDHYQELTEVEARVKREVQQQKKLDTVIEMGDKFIAANPPDTYLKAAESEAISIIDGKDITSESAIPGIRKDTVLNESIMATKVGENTGLIKGEYAAYIAFITKHQEPDMEKFEKEKDSLFTTALEKKRNDYLNTWYRDLLDNAKITDNRSSFFD
ncbi:MAG: peptidylprolyl isomerase [Candidatus Cloacimonadales bacterium]|nr:peptidylprolyl isomerase [Candidatus Cloacimonadales bacterium]